MIGLVSVGDAHGYYGMRLQRGEQQADDTDFW